MCLIATSKRQLATKDIVVYKRLEVRKTGKNRFRIRSPYRCTHWKFGKLKKANIAFKTVGVDDEVNTGLHAYTSKEEATWSLEENYHEHLFRCIIPKGSYYVLGCGKEIVSNQLKLGNPVDRQLMYQLKKQYEQL